MVGCAYRDYPDYTIPEWLPRRPALDTSFAGYRMNVHECNKTPSCSKPEPKLAAWAQRHEMQFLGAAVDFFKEKLARLVVIGDRDYLSRKYGEMAHIPSSPILENAIYAHGTTHGSKGIEIYPPVMEHDLKFVDHQNDLRTGILHDFPLRLTPGV